MHFLRTVLVGAFAALAAAQSDLKFTSAPFSVQAGQSYDLKWAGGDSSKPVTIVLREGTSNDLTTVSTLTSSATGGSFKWTVPDTLTTNSDYAFQINQGTATNYWGSITVSGGSASASASASESASVSASASASSSASSVSSVSKSASSVSSLISSVSAHPSIISGHAGSSLNATSISSATLKSHSTASTTSGGSRSSSSSTSGSSDSGTSTSNSASAPSQTGGASSGLKSNAALFLGVVVAMVYLG